MKQIFNYVFIFLKVSSVIDDSGTTKCIPCLGLAWANLVCTRLQLYRTNKNCQDLVVRRMEVIFSPAFPQNSAEFLVTGNGVTDVPRN